jgi:hypothetical protein
MKRQLTFFYFYEEYFSGWQNKKGIGIGTPKGSGSTPDCPPKTLGVSKICISVAKIAFKWNI